MRLEALRLKKFRSYQELCNIELNDLTALIGKNDVGKSTILEALDIFFGEDTISIEQNDLNVNAKKNEDFEIEIGCIFSDLPEKLIIDSTAETNLREEYLSFEEDGVEKIEIKKVYDASKKNCKSETFIKGYHYPQKSEYNDLHSLTIAKLKSRAQDLGVNLEEVDERKSSEIRKEIWKHGNLSDSDFGESFISADKDTYGKKIWSSLEQYLPIYALFQSDRPSKDQDDEVQDPLKIAIKSALKKYENDINEIVENVTEEVTSVAERTSKKMNSLMPSWNEDTFNPQLSKNLNLANRFKYEILGEDQIPINKRGSGVRRLILLAFFQAEAERRLLDERNSNIIYAVEEPETSQHPDHQLLLLKAFENLALQDNVQIILTTHVPGLANQLDTESIRYLKLENNIPKVDQGEEILDDVADTLGVLPNPLDKVEVLMYVEGKHDISFFKHMSKIIHNKNENIPDLENDNRVAIIPVGGGTLKDWINKQYLKSFNKLEFHIYDSDVAEYQEYIDKVNEREDASMGMLTQRYEMENYIPGRMYEEYYGHLDIEINEVQEDEDIVDRVSRDVYLAQGKDESIWDKKKSRYHRRLKNKVVNELLPKVTYHDLEDMGTLEEIKGWFESLNKLLK